MQVITTSPVEGVDSGTKITVDAAKGEWLVQNGYATAIDAKADESFGLLATSSKAKDDPTLAANREGPDDKAAPDGTPNPKAKQVNTLPDEKPAA